MDNFRLDGTYQTDIQTDFRFELEIPAKSELGLTETIKGYIIQSNLPSASGDPILWRMPGGMLNHQAGKRTVTPLEMTWVTATSLKDSVIGVCEKWGHATYDLNTGTNYGKANYCLQSGFYIILKSERNVREYTFELFSSQLTDYNYGTINTESNDMLRISMKMVYDNYQVYDRNGLPLRPVSTL